MFSSPERGKINIESVSGEEQLTDILTKPLGCVKIMDLHAKIANVNIEELYQDYGQFLTLLLILSSFFLFDC